jgi:hypothetical protein
VSNEFERMWDENFMAYFKVLAQHLSGGTEENHKNLSEQLVSQPRLKLSTS